MDGVFIVFEVENCLAKTLSAEDRQRFNYFSQQLTTVNRNRVAPIIDLDNDPEISCVCGATYQLTPIKSINIDLSKRSDKDHCRVSIHQNYFRELNIVDKSMGELEEKLKSEDFGGVHPLLRLIHKCNIKEMYESDV